MDLTSANSPASNELRIGQMIRTVRRSRSVTLGGLAQGTGISEATLSRIENDQSEISAHKLYRLAAFLEVDVSAFFETEITPLAVGVRSITRAGEGAEFKTPGFVAQMLCADINRKSMQPFINDVTASTLEDAGGCKGHDGEEFLHVLDGSLTLHSEHYAPLLLGMGDSIYFDGKMPHAYVSASAQPARILVITSAEQMLATAEINQSNSGFDGIGKT